MKKNILKFMFLGLLVPLLSFGVELSVEDEKKIKELENSIEYFENLPEQTQKEILLKEPKLIENYEKEILIIKENSKKKEVKQNQQKVRKMFIHDLTLSNNVIIMRIQSGKSISDVSIQKNLILRKTLSCSKNICQINDVHGNIYLTNRSSDQLKKLLSYIN